jgi:hypothetical protein
MSSEKMLVRIKPYNPKIGNKVRIFMYKSHKYVGERGWYEVSAELAEELAKLPQNPRLPFGNKVFDVCTREQAVELEEYEEAERLRVTSGQGTVTSSDGSVRRISRANKTEARPMVQGVGTSKPEAPSEEPTPVELKDGDFVPEVPRKRPGRRRSKKS